MIKVLVADDHPVVLEGLKQIIAGQTGMFVGGDVTNGQAVLDKVRSEKWDIVVLDLNMPGIDGFDVLQRLKRDRPKLPVLVLSMHPEDQVAVRVLRAGAAGYLPKESAPQDLANAIQKICAGGRYITPRVAETLAADLQTPSEDSPEKQLSNREFHVLCMIAKGKSVEEMADQLGINVKTIRTYRQRILQKLNLKNDVELTHYSIRHKLL